MPDDRQYRQRYYTVSILRPEAAVFHSSVSRLHSGVLLKTAINSVCSKFMQTDACILFDEGAHKSFITERLACDLHVQRTGTVSLHIAACGEKNDKLRHVDTATISYSCEFAAFKEHGTRTSGYS